MSENGSMYERLLAGESYRADDPRIQAELARAQRLTHRINTADPTDATALRSLFEELLGGLGEGAQVRPPFHCDYGHRTMIGADAFVNFGLTCLDVAPVTIGCHAQIGPSVQLLTPTHPLDPEPRRAGWESAEPIVLGDNVWLGGGVIVGPGVTIGDDTVVGAGAVVVRDLPAGVVAAGNPARIIRTL